MQLCTDLYGKSFRWECFFKEQAVFLFKWSVMSLWAYSNCQQLYFHPLPCQKLCIEIDLSCDSQSFHNTSKILSWDLIFYLYPCTSLFELFPLWAQVSHHAGQYWRQKFSQWWNAHTDTNQRVLRVFLIQFKNIYIGIWSQEAQTMLQFNGMVTTWRFA